MWTVVYMTKNEEYISSLRAKLKDNKIMVMVRSINPPRTTPIVPALAIGSIPFIVAKHTGNIIKTA